MDPSQRSLTVNTIEAAVDAVSSGLCFGWLPVYRVQPHLDSDELVPLNLPVGGVRNARFHLVGRDLHSSNHQQKCLADLLGFNRELQII